MTDTARIVAQLAGLALSPTTTTDAWERAVARLRDAVEEDGTLPVQPENVAQRPAPAPEEALT